jgi:hypothetical protein
VTRLRRIDYCHTLDVFDKLVKEACTDFAQLAKVPELSDPEAVHDIFYGVPFLWTTFAGMGGDAYFLGLLADAKHKATALHRQLEKVYQHIEGTVWHSESEDYNLEILTIERLPIPKISYVLKELAALTDALGRIPPPALRARGRHRGIKRYPGLYELVYELEGSARRAGGGFSVHRKLGNKGSLVQGLDRLRDRLLAVPDLKYLADLIPPSGKHPIAMYERALKRASEDVPIGGVGGRTLYALAEQ